MLVNANNQSFRELNIYLGESTKAPYDIHASATLHAAFNYAVLGSLIEVDQGNNLHPALLENFSYDFSKQIYKLCLRDNIKFHNGRTVNSRDLEFTILRGFFSKERNFFNTFLAGIVGLDQIKEGEMFETGKVSGVKIINERCIEIKLISENSTFLHSLSLAYFSLVPQEEFEKDYFTWKNVPVGAGKFKVLSKYDGKKVVVQNTDGLNLSFYTTQSENISYDISLSRNKLSNNISEYITPRSSYVRMFEFSHEHPLSTDNDFKCLFSYLINEVEFSDKNRGISKTDQLLPDTFLKNGGKKYEPSCSIKNAIKKFVNEDIKVAVFTANKMSENQIWIFSKITDKFKEYGLKITFEINEEKFPTVKTAKKYPVSTFSMVADYIDPLVMFSAYRKNGHAGYYTPKGEVAEQYESLYQQALLQKNFENKIEAVRNLSLYVLQQNVFVPFTEEKTIFFYNKDKIKDFGMPIDSLRLNFQNMKFKD